MLNKFLKFECNDWAWFENVGADTIIYMEEKNVNVNFIVRVDRIQGKLKVRYTCSWRCNRDLKCNRVDSSKGVGMLKEFVKVQAFNHVANIPS